MTTNNPYPENIVIKSQTLRLSPIQPAHLEGVAVIDYDKTLEIYGVDARYCHPASHQRVMMKCLKCHEQFARELRLKDLPHSCSSQASSGSKLCHTCGRYQNQDRFSHTPATICDDCHDSYAYPESKLEGYDIATMIGEDNYARPVRLEGKILKEGGRLPERSRATDAGYDIFASHDAILPAHGNVPVHTGMALSCPPGYYYTLDGRSGLGLKGIMPFRGIIDAGYTGEVVAIMCNFTNSDYEIQAGDRVAQIVLHRILHADITEVNEFSAVYSQRGTKGWGSSGK